MWYAGLLRLTWMHLTCWIVIAVLSVGAFNALSTASELRQKEVRQVRMIDAWSYQSCHKSNCREYWQGYFVDVKSNMKFEYDIVGSLYYRFREDNKPVTLDLALVPHYWDVERDDRGGTYAFLGFLCIVGIFISTLVWIFADDGKYYPNNKWFCL